MNQVVPITSRFDRRFNLAALDALLGPQGFASALDRHAATGCVRYVTLDRSSVDGGARVRITASYALSFPGRGQRMYTLLALDLRVRGGMATVLSVRRLGRLAPVSALTEAVMMLARPLANATMPTRAQLAPFLPPALLDMLENDPSAADFPGQGEREETLPEALWERPAVVWDGKIDLNALAMTLNLAPGERAQLTDFDPITGDYRVFHIGMVTTPMGGETLTFHLHRQAPRFERRLFEVLSLKLSPSDSDGLCNVEAFHCSSGASLADLPDLLPRLAKIVAALQDRKRPEDALLLPLLSEAAQHLWTQPLVESDDS